MNQVQFSVPEPYSLRRTFRLVSMGNRDQSMRLADDSAAMCFSTPEGNVTVLSVVESDLLEVTLLGDGASWIEPRLVALFGFNDNPDDFQPIGKAKRLVAQVAGARLPIIPVVFPRLVQIVLQQLVSWDDAANAWRNMVKRYGEPAPSDKALTIPPTPQKFRSMAYYDLVDCGVLPRQARLILSLAREAKKIETLAGRGSKPLCDFLQTIRGLGKWSIEYLKGTALGDADAELTGDYSLPHAVTWFLEGRPRGSDEEMLKLLEPFRPHRFRFVHLLLQSGITAPRRGPKMASNRYRFPR